MEHKETHSDAIRYMYIIRFKQRVHRHILRLIYILNLFNIHSREVPLYHALVQRYNGKWDTNRNTQRERCTYFWALERPNFCLNIYI